MDPQTNAAGYSFLEEEEIAAAERLTAGSLS
jgi:hypothetical protein